MTTGCLGPEDGVTEGTSLGSPMVVAERSEVAMDEFVPGQLGFLQAWLIGGPLDGTTYNDMPIFPGGKPADEAAIPLEDGLFARYARRDEI